jgi:hypothetical protein
MNCTHTQSPENTGRHHTSSQRENNIIDQTRHTNIEGSVNQHTDSTTDNHLEKTPSKKGLRKRTNIKIGTLNMNGLHISSESQYTFEKWTEINTTLRNEKIAILAVQETHLDEQNTEAIH